MPIINVVTLALAMLFLTLSSILVFKISPVQSSYVVHSGGGDGENIYLNCLEQVERNIKNGQKMIELDFLFTRDNHIIASHRLEYYEGFSFNNRPSLSQAMNTKIAGKYSTLTFETLADIMTKNNDVKIIFDTKEEDSVKMLRLMLSIAEEKGLDLKNRMIVQVFNKNNYNKVNTLGFKEYWFTNYKVRYFPTQINKHFGKCDNVTTIVLSFTDWKTFRSLNYTPNKKIAVHVAKSSASIKFLQKRGVDYIYRDCFD